MLRKLLKYDLKYMLKNMAVFYILSLIFAVTTRILFNINQSVIISIISQISVGALFSILASTLINTIMRSWIRFRDSLYKDESYLTNTLPVTKKELYNSKIIQTFIFFFISFIIILISLFITYYSKDNWLIITEYIKSITTGLNINIQVFIISILLLIFLEVFNAIQCGFYGIILGYKRNSNKLGYSILIGFIIYLIAQIMVLVLIFIYGLFDSTIMDLFKTTTMVIEASSFKLLLALTSTLYFIIIFIMSILCKFELNKGLNIE